MWFLFVWPGPYFSLRLIPLYSHHCPSAMLICWQALGREASMHRLSMINTEGRGCCSRYGSSHCYRLLVDIELVVRILLKIGLLLCRTCCLKPVDLAGLSSTACDWPDAATAQCCVSCAPDCACVISLNKASCVLTWAMSAHPRLGQSTLCIAWEYDEPVSEVTCYMLKQADMTEFTTVEKQKVKTTVL